MKKDYYKNLIDKYLSEDINNGTDKLYSVSNLWKADQDITNDDEQELILYIGMKCVIGVQSVIENKIDDMISNPFENSNNIDNFLNNQYNMLDEIIQSGKPKNEWKNKFNSN
jgi:hypothetical protein